MKFLITILSICLFTLSGYSQDPIAEYGVASSLWNQDLGNHRAVIYVPYKTEAAYVSIPWRRRDANPDKKRIIITDSQGNEMKNILRKDINRWKGDLIFQPVSGSGTYYLYYMPYKGKNNIGWFDGDYLKPEETADASWQQQNNLTPDSKLKSNNVKASVVKIESRTAFDSFFPMEVCATPQETQNLIAREGKNYLVFPEDRKFPIRMTSELPYKWIKPNLAKTIEGTAMQNEYFAFQIGLFAAKTDLNEITVTYSKYADKLTCFNLGGTDFQGKPFKTKLNIPKGKVQPLWFGFDIPSDMKPGEYSFDVIIQPKGEIPQTIKAHIKVTGQILADRGDSEPWRHSRLRWLNSTLGIDDHVVAPYTALRRNGNTIHCLMRSITLNDFGFIETITSKDNPVLNRPMQFVVETATGIEILTVKSLKFTKQNDGIVSWKAESFSNNISILLDGNMEFDGHIDYNIKVKALKDIEIKDIRLEFPVRKNTAKYFMGMGLNGQQCPEKYDWKWKGPQDSYWIGNTDAGFHCEMRGASYSGPLLNLYHPEPPKSWNNESKGGFSIQSTEKEVIATSYSGKRHLNTNEEASFEFALLITPVKQINTNDQFTNRYYHNGSLPAPKTDDLQSGIKITNVHHANPVNPYINYPFVAVDTMKYFVDTWHKKGLKVKIYYTIRELTNQVAEIWALRSLGTEILGSGPGGGYPWLQEHYVDNYNVQWFTPITGYEACDASVITSGQSRWYNYYIEGLRWLVKNVDIDGLYLDDVSFDRSLLKRMRKVMDSEKPGCILDLHSNTGFSKGPANQYTEYFPYINKLWFGESFIYNKMPPENWLVEVSGIPFGLMGDMLHGGGNPWRGMIYGMTVRYPWFTEGVNCDPREIWKVWDSFGIADAKMIGYWEPSCPVKTDNPNILATAYTKSGKVLVSIASWDANPSEVKLTFDWKALGLNPDKIKIVAPEIQNFQPKRQFKINESIPIEPAKGWLLVIE